MHVSLLASWWLLCLVIVLADAFLDFFFFFSLQLLYLWPKCCTEFLSSHLTVKLLPSCCTAKAFFWFSFYFWWLTYSKISGLQVTDLYIVKSLDAFIQQNILLSACWEDFLILEALDIMSVLYSVQLPQSVYKFQQTDSVWAEVCH